jgi:hypothetical protein
MGSQTNPTRFNRPEDVHVRSLVTQEELAEFVKRLDITHEMSESILFMEQRSDGWLVVRGDRVTGSVMGDAIGTGYKKAGDSVSCEDKLCRKLLWGDKDTFDKAAVDRMQYGNDHEDWARLTFLAWMLENEPPSKKRVYEDDRECIYVREEGLLIPPEVPWIGTSTDGIVYNSPAIDHLEIKCPGNRRFYTDGKDSVTIPPYYYAQIQSGKWNQRLRAKRLGVDNPHNFKKTYFVVWTPRSMQIQTFAYDAEYVEQMLSLASDFYFNHYLPRRVCKERGLLDCGAINPRSYYAAAYQIPPHLMDIDIPEGIN